MARKFIMALNITNITRSFKMLEQAMLKRTENKSGKDTSRKSMKSLFKITLSSSLLLCGLLLNGQSFAANSSAAKDKNQTTAETARLSVAQIKQDFQQLYHDLQIAHYDLFANTSKQEYDLAYQAWLQKIKKPMTVSETQVLFQQFMALGDVAHSRIDLPMQEFMQYLGAGGTMFPAYFNIDQDKLKGIQVHFDVVYADSALYEKTPELAKSSQVTAINGKKIGTWLEEISAYISSDNQTLANTMIENMLPYYLWLMLGEQNTFTLSLKSKGKTISVELPAVTQQQRETFRLENAKREALAIAHNNSGDQKSDSAENDIQEKTWQTMTSRIYSQGIAYLSPGPFYNTISGAEDIWDTSGFIKFVDEAYEGFIEQDTKALIIDLRNNPGGTNSFSDPIIAWFADKPFRFASEFVVKVSPQSYAANEKRIEVSGATSGTSILLREFYKKNQNGETFSMPLPDAQPRTGKKYNKPVYVLTNRYSYSNAVSFAAIVQDYGFATVIGEKTADLATTYGAMEHFDLKNSGITVGYPKALIIRPNGDTTPDGVTPDIAFSRNDSADLLEQSLAYIAATL